MLQVHTARPPEAPQPILEIRRFLQTNRALSIFVCRLKDFTLCRELYGAHVTEEIENLLVASLDAYGQTNPAMSARHALRIGTGEALLLRNLCPLGEERLMDQAFSLKMSLQAALRKHTISSLGREFDIEVGFSVLHESPLMEKERALHEAIGDARRMAQGAVNLEAIKLSAVFRSIVRNGQINVLFQPIYDFKKGTVLAWEALSRGPRGSEFESPALLFDFAEQTGQLFVLEQTCRARAIETVGALAPGQSLFLNIHPRAVVDPTFAPGRTLELIQAYGLEPENIVFEITERHSIKDFSSFHKTLDHYRSQGFKVAVDDAGTGYSGLSTIAALHPDYIKVDMSLVRDIDKDPVRRALMETMVTLAGRIGSEIIAEGIETKGEAGALIEIGVHYGQGYFLSRPHFPKPETHLDIRELVPLRQDALSRLSCSIPIGQLAQKTMTVSPRTPVQSVQRIFSTNPALTSVAVVEDGRPLGLVMGYSLDRHLATLYGRALYAEKPVSLLMDAKPLVADEREPVESVAKNANTREMLKAYDEVIVTREGNFLGVVTVQQMLTTLAQVQVEMAKGTNPLTGIPGNVALEKEVEATLRKGRPFAMLYADLDHFKVFNDVYGFKDGDLVILLLGRILTWTMARHGSPGDFLAHIGGDDFVAMVSPERAERICKAVVRCFRRLIPLHYHPQDRERGWIMGKGRDGREQQFPLVSVSIGIVECSENIRGCSLQLLGEKAAQVKSYAKSLPGNVYVRDRRGHSCAAAQ
ncbi:MAG TPA: GGDEF domain-containing protein [Desulfomicrobium sp.]|nr:GGDEF domain-containing protein [Desulfomicrobium sp.]